MATYEDLTKEQLINDLVKLRLRINELEQVKDQHEKTYDELVRTKAMYHGLFEFAPDAILVVNADGDIVQANAQAGRLFGYGRDEILGKPVEILMPERVRQKHIEHRQGYLHKPRVRPMGTGLDLYGKRKDGSEFSLDISLGPLEIEKDFFVVSVIRDMNNRKQMEEELRKSHDELEIRVHERTRELSDMNEKLQTSVVEYQRVEAELRKSENHLRHLSDELLTAQETERRRVAQEIHDSIGTSLAAVKYKVEDTLKQTGDNNPQKAALESVRSLTQETIEEARRIQMALRPTLLDDLGILATIRWFCRQFESTYSSIRIKQEIDCQEHEVSDLLKTVIFRVMQEALNNTAKHSKADLVSILLRKINLSIELVIRDNGQGFDLSETQSRKGTTRGLGLTSMRERTELSGGSFNCESIRGKGTTIRASWPLNESVKSPVSEGR
jgi:PAS domain S-box-containing protein